MLELRPTCENCDKLLPPESTEAMICSFECTYCADCAKNILQNTCPNCGGGFAPRPIRPANKLEKYPPSSIKKYHPVDVAAHKNLLARLKKSLYKTDNH